MKHFFYDSGFLSRIFASSFTDDSSGLHNNSGLLMLIIQLYYLFSACNLVLIVRIRVVPKSNHAFMLLHTNTGMLNKMEGKVDPIVCACFYLG